MDKRRHCKAQQFKIVIVRKKDNSIGLYVDFTLLNREIKREYFPIPVMEDELDYFSKGSI